MTAHDVLETTYCALLDALTTASDAQAGAPTRCRGWSAQDLVHHLLADAARALVALHTPALRAPDCDQVDYWRACVPEPGAVAGTLDPTRVMAAVWTFRPLVDHYAETAHAVLVASNERSGSDVVATQGRALTVDALRSTLAVEATVHQLDLGLGAPSGLGLAEVRQVLDGLLGQPAPLADDVRYALVGTGREPLSAAERILLGADAGRLPLFG